MYTKATSLPSLYIRNIIPYGMGNTPSGAPAPIGAGRCAIHPSAWNFSSTKFAVASIQPRRGVKGIGVGLTPTLLLDRLRGCTY